MQLSDCCNCSRPSQYTSLPVACDEKDALLLQEEAIYLSMVAANILEQSLPTENLSHFVHLLSPMTYVFTYTIAETENK